MLRLIYVQEDRSVKAHLCPGESHKHFRDSLRKPNHCACMDVCMYCMYGCVYVSMCGCMGV